MNWYLLEPRDPLMVRDGRPFGVDTDGARSLDFPPPSVVAGTLRSRVGFARGTNGTFGLSREQACAIAHLGPVLAELDDDGQPTPLLPAPADAVLFPASGAAPGWRRYRLHPGARWPAGTSSLDPRWAPVEPVSGLPEEKPARDAPAFWTAAQFARWLESPSDADLLPRAGGRPALVHERRTHLAIDPATGTAVDGKLFQTDGLRFSGPRAEGSARRMALWSGCSEAVPEGLATLGGERRLSMTTACARSPLWPAPRLSRARARVVLLTPAAFAAGSAPPALQGARVVAAAVGRPLTLSGWDLANPGPKATRRLAPAGAVYWVELDGADPGAWVERVHGACVSDEEQDRLDGFGLAAVGVWP